ncbi:hypothetical protein B6U74_05130 [Candidatus Bathyarchaeota archaeon ex4484_205]|nr:MAG: hypothetical protein B6U74_05130 [Candidatus Bathyarchaeota archaeon ex4484_205]
MRSEPSSSNCSPQFLYRELEYFPRSTPDGIVGLEVRKRNRLIEVCIVEVMTVFKDPFLYEAQIFVGYMFDTLHL